MSPGFATPVVTQPAQVQQVLVTTPALDTNASPSGWIDDGNNETVGNNVDAYVDYNGLPGLTPGDFRASTTTASTFDRTYDVAAEPLASQAQSMATVTAAFYSMVPRVLDALGVPIEDREALR